MRLGGVSEGSEGGALHGLQEGGPLAAVGLQVTEVPVPDVGAAPRGGAVLTRPGMRMVTFAGLQAGDLPRKYL